MSTRREMARLVESDGPEAAYIGAVKGGDFLSVLYLNDGSDDANKEIAANLVEQSDTVVGMWINGHEVKGGGAGGDMKSALYRSLEDLRDRLGEIEDGPITDDRLVRACLGAGTGIAHKLPTVDPEGWWAGVK